MSGKITKKRILDLLDDMEDILRDSRFTPEYKITETRVRIDVMTDALREELSGFKRD